MTIISWQGGKVYRSFIAVAQCIGARRWWVRDWGESWYSHHPVTKECPSIELWRPWCSLNMWGTVGEPCPEGGTLCLQTTKWPFVVSVLFTVSVCIESKVEMSFDSMHATSTEVTYPTGSSTPTTCAAWLNKVSVCMRMTFDWKVIAVTPVFVFLPVLLMGFTRVSLWSSPSSRGVLSSRCVMNFFTTHSR